MAGIPFLNNIDLNLNQLLQALLQLLGTDPTTHTEGQIWYNTATHVVKFRDDTNNRILVTDKTTLDQITAPAADVAMASHKITGMADPTSAQDAVTKAYVD